MPKEGERGFIWVPTAALKTYSDILVDGTSVKTGGKLISADFTQSLCPDLGSFKILLNNNQKTFSFSGGEETEFRLDRTDGTTTRFKGKVEHVKDNYDGGKGFTTEITGSHTSSGVKDVHVTEDYTAGDDDAETILKAIIDKYLSGFTYTGVEANTFTPKVRWVDKPFWDCVFDLCIADKDNLYDCYVNNSLDFKYFKRNSKYNDTAAIVKGQNLLNTGGLGEKYINIRNKVRVQGEDDEGLVILSTSNDSASQSTHGTKEKIIKNTAINDYDSATETADSNLEQKKEAPKEGKATTIGYLHSISPGDTIQITNPPQDIGDIYRIYKFTDRYPIRRTECIIQTEETIPGVFKEQENKLISQESSKNPHNLNDTLNLPFDNEDELSSKDSNMTVADGELRMPSGVSGTAKSNTRTTTYNVTKVSLQVVGESLADIDFKVTCDGGETETVVTSDGALFNIASDKQGTSMWLEMEFNSTSAVLKSIALLYS